MNNLTLLQKAVPTQEILPMLKADAYGHDANWVARVILKSKKPVYGLGVATIEEGVRLRQNLGALGRKTPVIVFSGVSPWTEAKGQLCERFGMVPVLATWDDARLFLSSNWPKRIGYEIKFNTGMNRLGLPIETVPLIKKSLNTSPLLLKNPPRGILSHLANAETPDSPISRAQMERFTYLVGELRPTLMGACFHLGNSAAIWNQKKWRLKELTGTVRPGLSLYGVRPWAQASANGLKPVMQVESFLVSVQTLSPGECVGYGATYVVPKNQPTPVGILSAGYADGIHRILSNQGPVWTKNGTGRFVGRISMDLAAISCSPKSRVGDKVELLGPHLDIWDQARLAGTAPYELLTSIRRQNPDRVQVQYA